MIIKPLNDNVFTDHLIWMPARREIRRALQIQWIQCRKSPTTKSHMHVNKTGWHVINASTIGAKPSTIQ
jgi:hypothetical protein